MKFEFSAGGIVYRPAKLGFEVLVAKHSAHHGWVFPKGLIGDKEENKSQTKEETAVREVKEETGIEAKIEKELEPVTYWYQWEGEKIRKTVYYFVMRFVGGDVSEHDHEMENVEWIDFDKVESKLTYPSDKKVWKEARELIK